MTTSKLWNGFTSKLWNRFTTKLWNGFTSNLWNGFFRRNLFGMEFQYILQNSVNRQYSLAPVQCPCIAKPMLCSCLVNPSLIDLYLHRWLWLKVAEKSYFGLWVICYHCFYLTYPILTILMFSISLTFYAYLRDLMFDKPLIHIAQSLLYG